MNLTEMEDKIVKAREIGIAICELNEQEQKVTATGIIFKIGVITGCQLPTNPIHVEMLEQELLMFINDYGYANFTTEEILTAFRMNANLEFDNEVKLYGSIFNIGLVGKVLSQYKSERIALDGKLANKFQIVQSEKEENERRQKLRIKIQDEYEKYLQSEDAELELNDLYKQLQKDGAFKEPMFFKEFIAEVKKQNEIKDEDSAPIIDSVFNKWVIDFAAEKLAVRCLFDNMKDSGQEKIYDGDFKIINPSFFLPKPARVPDDF